MIKHGMLFSRSENMARMFVLFTFLQYCTVSSQRN